MLGEQLTKRTAIRMTNGIGQVSSSSSSFISVGTSSGGQEHLGNPHTARTLKHAQMEWTNTFVIHCVDVRASIDQDLYDNTILSTYGKVQGCPHAAVPSINVDTKAHKMADYVGVGRDCK
ncbi:hypothetical protein Pan216_25310 [Planctomycetes bacterium Pan216]|uniref:Uncharacterized protein n=1 Tax=Kolteria novifilia TaxID=2527975 RepID=A0A518B3V3_9BACT|nr:hypothetical protein Pan216_25310 [Planctomycetes bacterium Pan216]